MVNGGLATVLILAVSTPAFTETSADLLKETAKQYYYGEGRDQNYTKALDLYLRAAHLGDAEAQFISGGMYYKGMGSAINYPKSFSLLYEAAINGESSNVAQKIIADEFVRGSLIPRDYEKALKWYTLAAEDGNEDAKNELAYMYYTGNGVGQDPEKGAEMFLESAYKGSPIAQYNVGLIYYSGNGLGDADLNKAYAWISAATSNGHQQAQTTLIYLKSTLSEEELISAQNYGYQLWKQLSQQ